MRSYTCPVCTGLAERQRLTLEQWWFSVQVSVCGAGVISPKFNSRAPSKSSSVRTSLVTDQTVTRGMDAMISTGARTFDTWLYFPPLRLESLVWG